MSDSDLMPRHALVTDGSINAELESIGGVPWTSKTDQRPQSHWLTTLLTTPPIIRASIGRMQNDSTSTTVIAGVESIRDASGAVVGVVATRELLDAEHLHLMCDGAHQDHATTRARLSSMNLLTCDEIQRLAPLLVRAMVPSGAQPQQTHDASPAPDHMSVMQGLISRMRNVDQPGPFLEDACMQLHEVVDHGPIVLYIADDQARLGSVAGRVIVAGRSSRSEAEIRSVMRRLLVRAISRRDADEPVTSVPLEHPIIVDGDVVGVLSAGSHDEAGAPARGESRLLSAAAGNIAIYLSNVVLYGDLNAMFLGTLEALTSAIDAKDRYTCGHSQRVAYLVQQLARASGIDAPTVARFHIAGLVHDIGKIGVPEHVLTKPGRLSEDEFRWIRRHPEIGERILRDIPRFDDIVAGVLHHHERWDGAGYPCGVAREGIPLVARMIAIADAFDAMTSTRTYRSALDRAAVRQEIERCGGSQFDPELVATFLALDLSQYDHMVETHRVSAMRAVA